jgi:hypothetical protein
LAAAAHDLRGALARIALRAEVLHDEVLEQHEARPATLLEGLARIESAVRDIHMQVDHLVDLASGGLRNRTSAAHSPPSASCQDRSLVASDRPTRRLAPKGRGRTKADATRWVAAACYSRARVCTESTTSAACSR